MNKGIKTFLIVWAIVVIAYNAIMAILKNNLIISNDKFVNSIITTNIAFLILLISGILVFKNTELKKIFYSLPIITYTYISLCLILVLNVVIMFNDRIPNYISVILSIVFLSIIIINSLLLKEGTSYIANVDNKMEEKVKFSNELLRLTKKMQNMLIDDDVKEEIDALYELVRYANFKDNKTSDEIIIIEKMNNVIEKCEAEDVNNTSVKTTIKEIITKVKILI